MNFIEGGTQLRHLTDVSTDIIECWTNVIMRQVIDEA